MPQENARILTTHVGSLARPPHLLDLMKANIEGAENQAQLDACITDAVEESVAQQVADGIDIVTDGEMSKVGFFAYVRDRMTGFSPRPGQRYTAFDAEVEAFPEYYQHYFGEAMLGGNLVPFVPVACTGPVSYYGTAQLQRDLDNLRQALNKTPAHSAFVPSVAPTGVGTNAFYASEGEYLQAVAEALRVEYKAIIDAGFSMQIDDPFLPDLFADRHADSQTIRQKAAEYVTILNHALRGLPQEKIRYHTCYSINEGPRIHDVPFIEFVRYMLAINAADYSFEAGNVRHEHEYHIWEQLKLPAGKRLIPGVICHASNTVEHPELIAERLIRFAERVGRENVLAGADCGFSSQATYRPEVHPTVVREKFRAMRAGAELASKKLWGR
ncbi:methionine synthase [Erwinia sp. OLTSP20]|uniref:cobalamin-independent methionine synthase II family protein n=1 Tax=unclassified Erwinia TaxID=2622719 RepID=UPI000C19F89A|nr:MULTISPECIES: cobalamin-independent methionine synthase II family protein [unclassified Erwinia]PIJ50264.1 methionine synthase [Erwinia sp. OAMSP11]PIJ72102.1 methionine synthase [Erwinia sp. OLSSP12]PIJ81393.1 methionine synthase [Erwinia sp. OLCASP19]PIJ84099.1 methionine synthase [Erwinia sp. OLMTSP26]PIJ85798.1 methionine synthase [Erwinia sp. OLMDSP33]